MTEKLHSSHVTRGSDAGSFDEICIHCGATDKLGSWEELANPCPEHPDFKSQRKIPVAVIAHIDARKTSLTSIILNLLRK
jgi:hypothetical protein